MILIKQFISCLGYLASIYLAGLICLPLTVRLFKHLPDHGYSISKFFGILVFSLVSWLLNAFGLLPFSTAGLWGFTGCAAVFSFTFLRISAKHTPLPTGRISGRYIVLTELVFIGSFFFWIYVRACTPDISHTEQPMDFMMLSAICQSSDFPVQDLWFSGYPVSYYYFGYWMQAVPTLLTGIPLSLAYNIGQSAWFALLFSGCFGLGACVAGLSFRRKATIVLSGLFCSTSLILTSNAAGLISALSHTPTHWWWWKASRAVFDGTSELITEFPVFSFILGDNHPHLLNLPILLLVVFYCLNVLFKLREEPDRHWSFAFIASCVLGAMQAVVFMVNSWDWPIAFGIGFLALILPAHGYKTRIRYAGIYAVCSFAILALLPVPYYLTAQNQINGISIFHGFHTGAMEWLHVFGLILPSLAISFAWILWQSLRRKNYSIPLILTSILFIGGLTAAFLPEYLFIRDVFNNRMNTVFKFYYQAWFYLTLAAALGIITAASFRAWRIPALLAALLMLTGLIYPARALYDLTHGFSLSPHGLDGTAHLNRTNPDISQAVEWISKQTPVDTVFLTAPGKSYEPDTVWVTMLTQRTVLLGWTGHEQQWRGPAYADMSSNRLAFIEAAYRNGPVRSIIGNPLWNQTDYFLVGPLERDYVNGGPVFLVHSMSNYLSPVFSNQTIMIYEKK